MTDSAKNITALKNSNRNLILQSLRTSPKSRAELSIEIGLAKSSVTTLTNQMIAEGLLNEIGPAEKSKSAGRTRILLDINPDFGFAVGINLHRKNITITGVDLKGNLIFSFYEKTSVFNTTESLLNFIDTQLPLAIQKSGLINSHFIGISVAAPGPLDCEKGMILNPPNFHLLNQFPVTAYLEKIFNCPAVLENDAVSLALFEHSTLAPFGGNSLFVTISDGIGGALLQNGNIYRGSHGIAGELGHISIDPFGELCPCGNRGCLEQYATLSSLQKRFGFSSYQAMIEGVESGNPKDKQSFNFLVETLGAAFVNAVNLFDLDQIILFGEYNYRADLLAKALESYITKHAVVCKVHPVSVRPAVLTLDTAPTAAAIPAINRFFKESII